MEIFLVIICCIILAFIVGIVLYNMSHHKEKDKQKFGYRITEKIVKKSNDVDRNQVVNFNSSMIKNKRRVIKPSKQNEPLNISKNSHRSTHKSSDNNVVMDSLIINSISDVGTESRFDYKPSTDHHPAPIEIERSPVYESPSYHTPSYDSGSSYDSGGSDCGCSCDCGGGD